MQNVLSRFVRRLRVALVLTALVAASHTPALAEPVGQGSGPLHELSTNLGAGSGPVSESGGSLRGINAGRLSGNPVRGSVTGDVRSGPVSEASVGPVTSGRGVSGGGSVGQSSMGAVTKDVGSPLGEMIAEPLHDLGPLQDRLRALQALPRTEPLADDPSEEEAAALEDEANVGADTPEPAAEEPEVEEHVAEAEPLAEPDAERLPRPAPDLDQGDAQPSNALEARPTAAEAQE